MSKHRVKTLKALQSRKSGTANSKLHPNSRRAKQLQRVELRQQKLKVQDRVHRSNEVKRVDRLLHFVHSLPEHDNCMTLDQLHQAVIDYIHRDDLKLNELEQQRTLRTNWRRSEGKSKREVELEKQQQQDTEEYKTGFVVPDLMDEENVFICRQWTKPIGSDKNPRQKGGDPSFLGRIRLISVNSQDKDSVKIVREGARPRAEDDDDEDDEVEMKDA
ncbi:translation machinery-associated protein 16 [Microbotryomycetes sp. JL221]|nr:translation machinery-associated protein 16 [Microbotryomycetes sp. JL221]